MRRTAAAFVQSALIHKPTPLKESGTFNEGSRRPPQPPVLPLEEEGDPSDNVELKVCYAHPQVRHYLRLLGLAAEWSTTPASNPQATVPLQSPLGFAPRATFSTPTLRDVKRAYYSRAMLVHPDAGLSGNSERFVEFTDAYKALLSEHSGGITRQAPGGYSPPGTEAYPRSTVARPRGLWDVPQPGHCPRYDHYVAQRVINRIAIIAGVITGLGLTACVAKSNQTWAEEHRGKQQAINDEWEKAFFARQGANVPQLVRSSKFHPTRGRSESTVVLGDASAATGAL